MKQLLLFLFITINFACSIKEKPKNHTIGYTLTNTQFQRLRNSYLYLTNEDQNRIIDSQLVTKSEVIFNYRLHPDTPIIFSSLRYWDTTRSKLPYLRLLGFRYKQKPNWGFSHFYLDHEQTQFLPEKPIDQESYWLKGSKQNIPRFQQVALWYEPDSNNAEDKKHVFQKNESIIKKYAYSIFLLEQLATIRFYFSPKEINVLLRQFDTSLQKDLNYTILVKYSKQEKNNRLQWPKTVLFKDIDNNPVVLLPTDSINLIVFWASWCAPCRKEIPALKQLYTRYNKKGLRIISISIDKNTEDWKKAISQEQMPWLQLLADDTTMPELSEYFNLNAIPASFLFKNQQLQQSFIGYSPNSIKKLEEALKKLQ